MLRWNRTVLPCVGALALAFGLDAARGDEPELRPLPPATSCKPVAPVLIELAGEPVARRGLVEIDYTLVPQVDVLDLDLTIELPDGGELLRESPPPGGSTAAGTQRFGSAHVELPSWTSDARGARILLHASILVADDEAPDGSSWATHVRTLQYGEVDNAPRLERVVSGGVESLEVPAIRR